MYTFLCILEALINYYFWSLGKGQTGSHDKIGERNFQKGSFLYLCAFKGEILFVRLFSIPRILLLIVRNGMFLTTKINSIPFEFFWWIFRWYVAEAGDARSKQDILIRIVWTSHIRLEFFMKSYLTFNYSVLTWFFSLKTFKLRPFEVLESRYHKRLRPNHCPKYWRFAQIQQKSLKKLQNHFKCYGFH